MTAVTFQIGTQHAGVINNVDGDMTISGGQVVQIGSIADARAIVRELGAVLDATTLSGRHKTEGRAHLHGIERELSQPKPDKTSMADRLTRLARLLASAGALTNAGSALAVGVASLASWLGRIGEPVQRLLSG